MTSEVTVPAALIPHVKVALGMLARQLARDGLRSPALEKFAASLQPVPEPAPESAIERLRRLDRDRQRRHRARARQDRDRLAAAGPAA